MDSPDGKWHIYINSPVGQVLIVSNGEAIVQCAFEEPVPGFKANPDKLTQRCALQLQEYFAGTRKTFDVPLAPGGTPFQSVIWNMLLQIPYGVTRSYAELARQTGNPDESRAVGHAVGQNPLLILIPCHRVLGSTGKLTGFAGGKDRKRWLLQHELSHSPVGARLF